MKFRDLLDNDQLILVACNDCNSKTPIDPAPPALELGVDADVREMKHAHTCPVCGSADIALRAFSPVAKREAVVASSTAVA